MIELEVHVTASTRDRLIERLESILLAIRSQRDVLELSYVDGFLTARVTGTEDPILPPREEEIERPIHAECHSDDYHFEINFDAARWFAAASIEEVLALADCGWGGDYAADEIARFFEPLDPRIHAMLDYLAFAHLPAELSGFECHIVEESAVDWLLCYRPLYIETLIDHQFLDREEIVKRRAALGIVLVPSEPPAEETAP